MMIHNKKSQVASTFTWFAGFLIIFFLMFLFLIASIGVAVQKITAEKLGSADIKGASSSLVLNEKIIAFWEYEKSKSYDIIADFGTTFKSDFESMVPEAAPFYFCYLKEDGTYKSAFRAGGYIELDSDFNCQSGYKIPPKFTFFYKGIQINMWVGTLPESSRVSPGELPGGI